MIIKTLVHEDMILRKNNWVVKEILKEPNFYICTEKEFNNRYEELIPTKSDNKEI